MLSHTESSFMKYLKIAIPYFFVIGGFLLDLTLRAVLYMPAFMLMRLFFYCKATQREYDGILFFSGFFILLESMIYHQQFGIDLLVMVPLVVFLQIVTLSLTMTRMKEWICALLALFIHYVAVDHVLFQRPLQIMGSLKVMVLYCILVIVLTHIVLRGSRGNRSERIV